MAKKKTEKAAEPETELNAKRELFCRYYTQNDEMFGNATLSYAEAYGYKLDELAHDDQERDEDGKIIEDSSYDKAYHVCSVEASKLLRNPEVNQRNVVLLNELLKDEVVDSELAKVIKQDRKLDPKVGAIREYNKLRGRIIDHTKITQVIKFDRDDIRTLISFLPIDLQQKFYATLTELITEAESRRSAIQGQVSAPQLAAGHTG